MADGLQKVVFVAGDTDGWLFWSTDSNNATIEQAAKMTGLNSLNAFAHTDVV